MNKVVEFLSNNTDLHSQALQIRRKVFIEEQGVDAQLELEFENECIHFGVFHHSKMVGTARMRTTNFGVKLERFAILVEFRGLGLGNDLLRFVVNRAKKMKKLIYLNAQYQVVNYYQKWGFVIEGDEFYEANIKHFKMVYKPYDIMDKALSKAICRR